MSLVRSFDLKRESIEQCNLWWVSHAAQRIACRSGSGSSGAGRRRLCERQNFCWKLKLER